MENKINGLAQAVDYVVGRVSTTPNATVTDSSCLRPECHNTQELISSNMGYKGINFTHKSHIEKTIGGIRISCSTCHSHFEGGDHFNVNSDVCFSCHSLKDSQSESKLVQVNCQDCHGVPNGVIGRGLATVNHVEFVSSELSCDDSCHKGQIEKESKVADGVCLNCHSFSNKEYVDSAELHEIHTTGEKVECFACHGKVSHGPIKDIPPAVMMDCKNCHSDTHNIQLSIYAADEHPQKKESDHRILSPMFLTHVKCTGCHIELKPFKSGTIAGIGKVAKAVPQACDSCHEPGTGQRYIPFWQGKIKALYEKVSCEVDKLEERAQLEIDEQLKQEFHSKVRHARSILESVSSDGSWGVHNFKYIEAMLLKAHEIVTEVR